MQPADWINLAFFSSFLLLAFLRPLEPRRRRRAVAFGIAGVSMVVLLNLAALRFPLSGFSLIRDWAPAPLMLVAYWQAGQLVEKPSANLQSMLASLDRIWWKDDAPAAAASKARAWLGEYFELAYLTCYPLVPLAFGFCYFCGSGQCAGEFWSVVLPPTYLCYALVPFFPHLPPRTLSSEHSAEASASKVRRLNLWLLRHASIGVNTFPSAHVASTVAASLVLWGRQPDAGVWFLLVSLSIAVAVAARRYHYALDSLAAAALAVAAFLFNTYILN